MFPFGKREKKCKPSSFLMNLGVVYSCLSAEGRRDLYILFNSFNKLNIK